MVDFQRRLHAVSRNVSVGKFRRGIEKEALRVSRNGDLSTEGHPDTLGAALTHPHVTTDFSEAQLEFITDVHSSVDDCLTELTDLHSFVYANVGTDVLWPTSMPCFVGNSNDIPVAHYGSSNEARVKTIYRLGLGNRYGRLMQTISGIHYNFSFPTSFWPALAEVEERQNSQDYITQSYMSLIRNFRRMAWLLIYLFGASPAVCKSFLFNVEHQLETFDDGSLFLPNATSLRMGPIGYQSIAQSDLYVSFNSLTEFIRTIKPALTEPYPAYEHLGLREEDDFRQLNAALLQTEAEFYGTIRPKRKPSLGERPILALAKRGVEYVEIRCLDLDPFDPVGINASTAHFLDAFLLYSMLLPSPDDNPVVAQANYRNQLATVHRGRDPNLLLECDGSERPLREWALEILEQVHQVAAVLDNVNEDSTYSVLTEEQIAKVYDAERTPSAQVLREMKKRDLPFSSFGQRMARLHLEFYQTRKLSDAKLSGYEKLAEESRRKLRRLEEAESVPFETYLEKYLRLDELS